jgi:hypothetical protein
LTAFICFLSPYEPDYRRNLTFQHYLNPVLGDIDVLFLCVAKVCNFQWHFF